MPRGLNRGGKRLEETGTKQLGVIYVLCLWRVALWWASGPEGPQCHEGPEGPEGPEPEGPAGPEGPPPEGSFRCFSLKCQG